ncbi:MAG: hypothetical protein AAB300_00295 [Nitrospirota bacterium]
MSKTLIDALRAASSILAPFSDPSSGLGLRWNGTAYVPATSREADTYAAKWWMALVVVTEMLNVQDGPLTTAQKKYLEKLLCGGMGSFNDFFLDEDQWGEAGSAANAALNSARSNIYSALCEA